MLNWTDDTIDAMHRVAQSIQECRAQVESEVHKTEAAPLDEALRRKENKRTMLMIRGSGKACQVLREFQAFCQTFPSMTMADLEAQAFFMLPLEFK